MQNPAHARPIATPAMTSEGLCTPRYSLLIEISGMAANAAVITSHRAPPALVQPSASYATVL